MTAKDLVVHFVREYRDAMGIEYPVAWAKHCRMAKRLLVLVDNDGERAKKLVSVYLRSFSDRFYMQKGKPLDLLSTALPALLAKEKEEAELRSIQSTNYDRLERAAKAAFPQVPSDRDGQGDTAPIQEPESDWDADLDPSARQSATWSPSSDDDPGASEE